jgi:hypothetical protein
VSLKGIAVNGLMAVGAVYCMAAAVRLIGEIL